MDLSWPRLATGGSRGLLHLWDLSRIDSPACVLPPVDPSLQTPEPVTLQHRGGQGMSSSSRPPGAGAPGMAWQGGQAGGGGAVAADRAAWPSPPPSCMLRAADAAAATGGQPQREGLGSERVDLSPGQWNARHCLVGNNQYQLDGGLAMG